MRELSLHILDLVRNSVEAGAGKVDIRVMENHACDQLTIIVKDDGRGMTKEQSKAARDPFVTSRTVRKVGLGIPLIDMSTRQAGGSLTIASRVGEGTLVEARYQLSHWDRPPLGNMAETLKIILVSNPGIALTYCHSVDEREFCLSSAQIQQILKDVPITHPSVLNWLTEYITSQLANLYGGETL